MAYRSDEDALEARRQELERELTEVNGRVSELDSLQGRRSEIEKQLADLAKSKAAFQRTRLPLLANAKIASPCSADWEKMVGDEQVRFCGSCQKNVYNLSAMTAQAAEALLREKEGSLCARLYRRADGTVITADCPAGVRKKWVSRVAGAAVLFGGAAAAGLAYEQRHTVQAHSMGAIAQLDGDRPVQPVVPEMGTAMPPQMAPPSPDGQGALGQNAAAHPPRMGRVQVKPQTPPNTPKKKPAKVEMGEY